MRLRCLVIQRKGRYVFDHAYAFVEMVGANKFLLIQAYDDRIQLAQKNKKHWDEQHDRRVKTRDEWARQVKERSEARMKERADFYESLRRIKEEEQRYAEMVELFYQELRDSHPEWESRRQAALQVRVIYLFIFDLMDFLCLQRKEMADKGQIPRRYTTRI